MVKIKQIKLTQGQFAIVDDKNYEWLSQYKWYAHRNKSNKTYYAIHNGKKENSKQYRISMSREILGLNHNDKKQSDHRNHNTLDNRESNLQIVTHQQNQWNRKNPKGYYWDKKWKKYVAMIRLNGKGICLGGFDTAKEARNTYLKAKEKYHKI